jgi:hypothetical protein
LYAPNPFDVVHEHFGCIRSAILLCWFEIWKTSPLGGLLALAICKIEKKLFNSIFRLKMQKILQETHFGYIDASDLIFYSITLKFEPQMHKEMY